MVDRTGQVWTGVFLEDEGDLCVCLRSEQKLKNLLWKHLFLDLETGETYHAYEHTSQWASADGRRRIV